MMRIPKVGRIRTTLSRPNANDFSHTTVILIIALLVLGAYNMKKGQSLSNHSTSVSEVDSDERHCREADYQQPDILDKHLSLPLMKLMHKRI